MAEIPNVEHAKDALAKAQAAHESVLAQIKNAEDTITNSSPARAVAAGISLADAASAHNRATADLAFLKEAQGLAWNAVLSADAALKSAMVHSTWSAKLDKAISARIAAAEAYEAATTARRQAEADYKTATDIIASAHAAGMPRPTFLKENPLYLPMIVDHFPQMQIRPAADERRMWGSAK